MCGIIGYTGNKEAYDHVKKGLSRLEYRGYDSAGIATSSEQDIHLEKVEGSIEKLSEKERFSGKTGIGHTRWATHGEATRYNAHPHTDCTGRIAIVHNGIIENYEEINQKLDRHSFKSETDSETVAHFLEEKLESGNNIREAIEKFQKIAEGTYAIAVLQKGEEKIVAAKNRSPLAVGLGEGENFIGSDIYAFSEHTDRAVFMEDGEIAEIGPEDVRFFRNGEKIEKTPEKFEWTQKAGRKKDFEHYMIKEIEEQPEAVKRLSKSLGNHQSHKIEELESYIKNSESIVFTAAGTSYHSSMIGASILRQLGYDARAMIASEFQEEILDEDTLVVAVSQSGETMDVIETLDTAREKGCSIASVVNVPYSTIQRMSDIDIEIMAGQEICVASTKSFTNQVLTLMHIGEKLGLEADIDRVSDILSETIEKNQEKIENIAEELEGKKDIFVLGRGSMYPLAREIALKLKEISYIHAEGMMGGELKHGTLALIEEGTPVISLIPEENSEIINNVDEVSSRGARSIEISPFRGNFETSRGWPFMIQAATIGFLLSYHIARNRGLPIDKPRNLAKSVTVK